MSGAGAGAREGGGGGGELQQLLEVDLVGAEAGLQGQVEEEAVGEEVEEIGLEVGRSGPTCCLGSLSRSQAHLFFL